MDVTPPTLKPKTKSTPFEQELMRDLESRTVPLEQTVLSRWTFEQVLDALAKTIQAHLEREIRIPLGCSILYERTRGNYFVGGSSTDRRTMNRRSRYYDLGPNADLRSWTASALRRNLHLVVDDFVTACSAWEPVMRHGPKACELASEKTRSYYFTCEPSAKASTSISDHSTREEIEAATPCHEHPAYALRVTSSKTGVASKVDALLTPPVLGALFELVRGRAKQAADNTNNSALALADLQADLLAHRTQELRGLDRLAHHLQTLFERSECSIFLANLESDRATTYVALRLAASTAKTDSEQHQRFRTFFDIQNRHYSCSVQADGRLAQAHTAACAKTEQAYYHPTRPVRANARDGDTQSPKFPEAGELEESGSFLAIAIPASDPRARPHGVIRIVRETADPFSDTEYHLAAAIARALTPWLECFPRNEQLAIAWRDPALEEEVLHSLFSLPYFRPARAARKSDTDDATLLQSARLELRWLFQRVFARCKKVAVKRLFSGRSGCVVMLVENDAGLDLILKCRYREEAPSEADDAIATEIRNYTEYIEGKLLLTHNVIYPELLRETRHLVGFATSFLGARRHATVSLTQHCEHVGQPTADLEGLLTTVVERFVHDVWSWWLQRGREAPPRRDTLLRFIDGSLVAVDGLFSFMKDLSQLDARVLPALDRVFGEERTARSTAHEKRDRPSQLWQSFCTKAASTHSLVEWQETVTHGDLHGDNIFVDPHTGQVWVIDFARTGVRPSVFDLAMLEMDLKCRHLRSLVAPEIRRSTGFLKEYQAFEQTLASQRKYEELVVPGDGNFKALRCIAKAIVDIRQLACQALGRRGNFLDYQAILLLLAFKFMKVSTGDSLQKALAYLSAVSLIDIAFANSEAP